MTYSKPPRKCVDWDNLFPDFEDGQFRRKLKTKTVEKGYTHMEFENVPVSGMSLSYKYGGVLVKDPRGFQGLISWEAAIDILSKVSSYRLTIQDECVWGWYYGKPQLILANSEDYINIHKLELYKSKRMPLRQVKRGSKVLLQSGEEYLYLGRFNSYNINLSHGSEVNKTSSIYLLEDLENQRFDTLTRPAIYTVTEEGSWDAQEAFDYLQNHSHRYKSYALKGLGFITPKPLKELDLKLFVTDLTTPVQNSLWALDPDNQVLYEVTLNYQNHARYYQYESQEVQDLALDFTYRNLWRVITAGMRNFRRPVSTLPPNLKHINVMSSDGLYHQEVFPHH